MYQKIVSNLITSLNKLFKKVGKQEITLGMARKNGIHSIINQAQKELNKTTQKEISNLSKDMQNKYIDTYVDVTGSRRPLKKAKQRADFPWSGMSASQRILKNAQNFQLELIQGLEDALRNGATIQDVLDVVLNITNKYSNRHDILVRTELWHMYSQGMLDGYIANKIHLVQYVTTGDDRVCPECVALEQYNEGIYSVEDAPTLPRHPSCRCQLIPYEE